MKEVRVRGEESIVVIFLDMNEDSIVKRFVLCGGVYLDLRAHQWCFMTGEGTKRISALQWMLESCVPQPIWMQLFMDLDSELLPMPFKDEDFDSTEQGNLSE